MKGISIAAFLTILVLSFAQAQELTPAQQFWATLQSHCGKAYTGELLKPENDPQFGGKELVMHVRKCSNNEIKIPFFVGDDRSRTWVFTFDKDRIILKHDHRHEDGTEDKITQYGGTSNNTGQAGIQVFPADAQTTALLPLASTNVWWVTLSDTTFTYNLRRLGNERVFTVEMDLTKEIEAPAAPWGWED